MTKKGPKGEKYGGFNWHANKPGGNCDTATVILEFGHKLVYRWCSYNHQCPSDQFFVIHFLFIAYLFNIMSQQ